jgi:transposase
MDVHKDKIVACILTGRKKEIRSFSTMTSSLLEQVDWLKHNQCQCVAMEATGAYWKPIYNLLEMEEIPTLVVNAQHIKAVPGRKTDVKDSEWIADLLRHGLLKGSFIPSRDQRELKEIVRYRRSITEERAREINRIQKVLEGANIKLASVVSSIDCTSARKMLNELVAGNNNIEAIANLAIFPLSNKIDQLKEALYGLMGDHQRLILKLMLKHIDDLDAQISTLDNEIKKRLQPQQEKVNLIDGIPGIGERSAQTILAEIGTDMSVFPSAAHLASWAGMCPGNHESAGKRKSGKTRKGNNVLRSTLIECAKAARNSKNTYLSSQYHRIAARRGNNRATVAVGHTILTIAYHILRNNVPYKELGSEFFEQRRKNDIIRKSVNRLEAFGLKVSIEEPLCDSKAQ